ncbi:hypothetical protein KBA63_05560, partial [Candidatus Woesebacteria bacterium]|nr:hypothetical protein [Candidatus Woesebacteria bacterium]
MKLVVIEAPNKIKSFHKALGDEFEIVATKGHIIDLPSGNLDVDIKND